MIDVVIPTIGRASLKAAAESARRQHEVARVLVVLDRPGDEEAVRTMLRGTAAELILSKGGEGGSVCRQLGVSRSTAPWIAFLDDDDIWLAGRFAAVRSFVHEPSPGAVLITASFALIGQEQMSVMQPGGEAEVVGRVIPRRPPFDGGDNLASYLASRRSLRYGYSGLQSSGLLLSRSLAETIAWDANLRKHQDWDYLIQAEERAGLRVHQTECRVITQQNTPESVSARLDWSESVAFLEKHRSKMSKRATADFLAVHVLRVGILSGSMKTSIRFVMLHMRAVPHWGATVGIVEAAVRALRGRVRWLR
ncbi:glycosyltransferase family A protein [Curtobacterium sp. TXMA1]|uniref:glycosyltransferase family A protein n=1 Tax=Curtobacterium sp. TXMA1 TaxID=2876939 RepID=UPI001CCE872C|nr:glycosyltransferase family A protein [Curtobacterium sp. TXMA1]UBQ03086.1 glycosyltransferase family 2 protein [Curtobacterium sp. TXMA1]